MPDLGDKAHVRPDIPGYHSEFMIMEEAAVVMYRLRFRFSPPSFIPQGTDDINLHVEVVDECGQGVSSCKAHPEAHDVPGWEVAVGMTDALTNVPISTATSVVTMAPDQSHTCVKVLLPNVPLSFRFHANLHSTSSSATAPATTSLRSFTCATSMSVQARILVLPVWSDLIVRAQPPLSTLLSVSCCLRLFSVHTPAGSVKVTVEERYGHAMASHVWDAGICLSFFLQTHYIPHLNPSTSLRAMEIASGSGLLGLVLATLLPARSTLVLTEKPTSLELLQHNLEQLQPISSTHISICGLEWGNQVHLLDLPHRDKSTDLLVLADVLYNWAAHPQLWSTVAAVASPSTTIYLAHKHRAATSTAALRHLETHGTCPSCPAVSCALNSPSSCGWKNGLWKLHRCASYGATDIFQLVIQPPHTEMDV